MSNVSISVWYYKELEKKYNKFGQFIRYGPKYSTAVTNKLFFDIDCYTNEGVFINENYEGMQRLWKYAKERNVRREIAFTGGGYQLTLSVKVRPEYYESTIMHLSDITRCNMDECISLAGMRRVVGSYNFGKERKSARNVFCISLTESELGLNIYEHIMLAGKQRKGINYYGTESLTFKNFKRKQERRVLDRNADYNYSDDCNTILNGYGYDYTDICESIRSIIEQPRVGHKERMIVIKYLKAIVGIKYGDMLILLPKILTSIHGNSNDGVHSIEEGQVDSIYGGNLQFSPRRMKDDGYCNQDCEICSDYLKALRQL